MDEQAIAGGIQAVRERIALAAARSGRGANSVTLVAVSKTMALQRLAALGTAWQEIPPTTRIRQTAERLLRVHPLRAADALQLAAAIAAADGDPRSLPFVTLDDRLARAAEREGFPVVESA